ncbi:MAG: LacI family DNA-binding transcriptional regulator [Acidihalobacter sp.]|uniref:LacI family DNA-binding transcriptional regulator n=1 Tax=Acidihalobacter sp. TaxID=1872108 RepID=UPI00307F67AA
MADVAHHAGTSMISVSRAFRHSPLVSEALKTRIFSAATELGYVPNRAASALASARSMNIAVLIPSMTNTVFVDTLAGINTELGPRGYQMLIGTTDYSPEEEFRLLRTFLEFSPDGLLIAGADHLPSTSGIIEKLAAPTVHLMEIDADRSRYSVGLSQTEGGYAIGRHLVARGYTRIGFVAAQLDPRTLARGEGYRQALQEAGLYEPRRELRVPDRSSISLGAELLDRMLDEFPDTDALFFCNDDLAQGALFHCQRRGISVPQDLALAGFNDLPVSAWTVPSLTTIATPRYEIGVQAARMLLGLLSGEQPAQPHCDLGFELKTREST